MVIRLASALQVQISMHRLEALCQGETVDPHGREDEEMENLMRAAKHIEPARREAFRRSCLHEESAHVSIHQRTVTYRKDEGPQSIETKLQQVPLHPHVFEHVFGPMQPDPMQKWDERRGAEQEKGSYPQCAPFERPELRYRDQSDTRATRHATLQKIVSKKLQGLFLGTQHRSFSSTTHKDPVDDLKGRMADEKVVDGCDKGAADDDCDPGQVLPMPELFDLVRVWLHEVVDGAREQAELASEEKDCKHDIICGQYVCVLGLGEDPHVDVRDGPNEDCPDEVGVDVARLVVQICQAQKDASVVGLFWTVAAPDELVVARPLLDLVPPQESRPPRARVAFQWMLVRCPILLVEHLRSGRASVLEGLCSHGD